MLYCIIYCISEEPNCELCEQPLEILDFPASSKDAKKVTESGEPTIIVDEPDFKNCRYNYTFLRDFYFKNKADLDFSVCEVYGDRGNQRLEDFFKSSEEEIIKSKMSFGWYVYFGIIIATKFCIFCHQFISIL